MLSTTRGIIFRRLKYGDTSLIMDIYTSDFGLRSYIVGGVLGKKKKTKSGLLQIMGLVELVAYHKPGDGLTRIKEIRADVLYQSIPFQIVKSTLGTFLIEVTKKSIKEKEQNIELYEFLRSAFLTLDKTSVAVHSFHLIYLLKLSEHIGFGVESRWSEDCPWFDMEEGLFVPDEPLTSNSLSLTASKTIGNLLLSDFHTVNDLALPKAKRLEVLEKILIYYKIHVPNFTEVKSLAILRELFH